ncbi:MAG: trigger factor [Candidatus Borkfalkiaceae bacterium]|nr:trigger factor [Christensenellaceae bacterium]
MKYTFEKTEKSTVKITINLEEKEWNEAIDAAYEKVKGKYSMPGFRKGKVPKKVLESAYGAGVFYEEAINIAFPKYYEEVLDKEPSIEAVARPDIDIKDISEKGISMIAEVAVKPEVKLGEYKGITFKKVEYNVKEADVKDELKRLQERNSRTVDVTDRAVESGDTVTIDYSGSVDGVKFEGGTAEKQPLTIGSNTFIPGFEDQIIGMKIGEEKDINVKFPEDYHAENLKGKDSVFHIVLHEIKAKELPELTDEFIKDAVGAESLDAYKKEIKERLKKQNKDRAEREIEDEIVKKVTANAEVVIPEALIDNQIDQMVNEMSYRLSYQGLKLEDYLKYVGKTMEEYRKGYYDQAKDLVKSQLVIGKIIEEEKIDATEEDVTAKIEEMAKAQGKKAPDLKKDMAARQLDYVKNEIIVKKLFDFLKSANEIKK